MGLAPRVTNYLGIRVQTHCTMEETGSFMGDHHSGHWSRRKFLRALTLGGTAALAGLELKPQAAAAPASLPLGDKWPRFGWSAAPEWQTSPGQIASNGGNSQSQALVYNWLLWPSSMADGTTIKRILA